MWNDQHAPGASQADCRCLCPSHLSRSFHSAVTQQQKPRRGSAVDPHFSPSCIDKPTESFSDFSSTNAVGSPIIPFARLEGEGPMPAFILDDIFSADSCGGEDEDSALFDEKLKKAFNVDSFGVSGDLSLDDEFNGELASNLPDFHADATFCSEASTSQNLSQKAEARTRRSLSIASPSFSLSSEGVFDLDAATALQDPRRTLCIRNIPVRYTRKSFMEFVDRQFRGLYDYLYLPLDPQTQLNLGYAFINIPNADHVHQFFQTFNGRRWKAFRSHKICEVKYARIQGKSWCTEKFEVS